MPNTEVFPGIENNPISQEKFPCWIHIDEKCNVRRTCSWTHLLNTCLVPEKWKRRIGRLRHLSWSSWLAAALSKRGGVSPPRPPGELSIYLPPRPWGALEAQRTPSRRYCVSAYTMEPVDAKPCRRPCLWRRALLVSVNNPRRQKLTMSP